MLDNQKNHPEESIFHAYLDNELPYSEKKEFEDHLNQCPECARTLTLLKELFSRIEGLPVFELSKDLSKEIVVIIQNQNRVFPILNRISWFQTIITTGLFLVMISLLPNIQISNTLTEVKNTVVSNIETVIINTSKFMNTIIFPIQNIESFTFRDWDFSIMDLLTSDILITISVCSCLLWFIGNRFLLSYKSQTNFPNGG